MISIPQTPTPSIDLISISVLPVLLQDMVEKAEKWGNDGKTGRIDPFNEIYDVSCIFCVHFSLGVELAPRVKLIFATTARIFTCHDLIKNEADFKKVGELLVAIQTSVTPTSLVLPWFPSLTRWTREQATTELCTILYTYIESRRHAEPTNDAIDLLIAGGEATQDIIGASRVRRSSLEVLEV